MRALRVGEGGTTLADVPMPVARGEAIIRVTMSGVCNTDLELARGYMGFQGTIGHEFVGVIEDAGGGPLPVGTRVVGEINAGCGECARCERGDSRHCKTRTVLGIVGRDGAHADYLALPARNLCAVPDGVSDRAAVFVEPLAAACGVMERAPLEPGSRVAVIGDGKLGILCARALAAAGHEPTVIGRWAPKLALAKRGGGVHTRTIEQARAHSRRVYDTVIEASGGAAGFGLALDLLKPQGRLVLKSTFHGATPIDAARVVVDEITVIGSRCGRFAPALELLSRGAVTVEDLISEVVPLDRATQALEQAAAPGVLKILLEMQ